MFLMSVANKLELDGLGTQGRDLFLYRMPKDAKVGILLLEPQYGSKIDHELPGYRMVRYPISVRAPQALDGFELAKRVIAALSITRMALGDHFVNYMRPVHDPVPFPVDEGDLVEYAVHFDACYTVTGETT